MKSLFPAISFLCLSALLLRADPLPRPKSAEIENHDVKVTYTDGHTDVLTTTGNCRDPHVSSDGVVGCLHYDSVNPRGYQLNDLLHLRFPNGKTKQLKPHPQAPFIMQWRFEDNGRAVAIQSMQHHGPPYFIKYNLESGRVLGTVSHYVPEEQLPAWARSLATP